MDKKTQNYSLSVEKARYIKDLRRRRVACYALTLYQKKDIPVTLELNENEDLLVDLMNF